LALASFCHSTAALTYVKECYAVMVVTELRMWICVTLVRWSICTS